MRLPKVLWFGSRSFRPADKLLSLRERLGEGTLAERNISRAIEVKLSQYGKSGAFSSRTR